MSDAEKVVIGIILTALISLIVWQIQANFNDIKNGIKEIRDGMVGKVLCSERHRAIEEKLEAHSKSIRHLYRKVNKELEPKTEEGEET
jgi:uncharacterized membrane protein YgaE (UPF0421/DUF939 family)